MAGWRDHGSKPRSGGMASASVANVDRRERLRQLALETIDLSKDPYFMRNHLGSYECKLCLTLHSNEANYLAHTQGRRHQQNLARRAAREKQLMSGTPSQTLMATPAVPIAVKKPAAPIIPIRRKTVKIGIPGYTVLKKKDPETGQKNLLFTISYPEIADGHQPRHRFMGAYEQRVEAPDKNYLYLLFAAEPYETIAFKIPAGDIERSVDPNKKGRLWTEWNKDTKTFTLQLYFKLPKQEKDIPQKKVDSTTISNPLNPMYN
eukprot:CAMPEP_0168518906 /NCGR_PEP_ID=MMETSP0405-20121227/6999_1 /TAXON_ID=498012 /ORGANISM="Trichosphaerium sp, Strain Am-I-7 wt" /LENGTH=261 /DNA_ID=CAMNT_0008539343 /DNA_START=25 /DNA_END=810 /DNA_ORIENTATION=+